MNKVTACVTDTSVIIKALFSPSHKQAGATFSREQKTHKNCIALLNMLDEQGTEVIIPRCGIVEIAAVAGRLADASRAEEICDEVEASYKIIPEDAIIMTAKAIALNEGCPGFDTYFVALAEQDSLPRVHG
ncbi:MAG TPA: hypothetical protein VHN82_02185 [Methanoregula sp.]|nr:hypothetical protein [Methanoregula sp.]